MTSPHRVSEQETIIHHLVAPTARILAAVAILITGLGISAIFWKMPGSTEQHALCYEGVVDKNLSEIPLPDESLALLAPEERFALPTLDIAPVTDGGAAKYTQVFPLPASLAALDAEQQKRDVSSMEDENETMLVAPQKFEPLRRVVVEKPIFVESVNRDFQSQPASVSTAEKSEELHSKFQFAENIRADSEDSAMPTDPFPVPVAASTVPALQPLQSIRFDNRLTPLAPLQASELQSFVTPSL